LESFNVTNTPGFGIPQRWLEAPGFGNHFRTTVPSRRFQASIKVDF